MPRRPKTIRPDGSLDSAADFEDDGASFRVRRERFLDQQYSRPAPPVRPGGWSWRYLRQKPRNGQEAVGQGLKIGLRLVFYVFLFLIAFVVALIGATVLFGG